jgi:hypothetical protein
MVRIQRNYWSDVYLWSAENQARLASGIEKHSGLRKKSMHSDESDIQHSACVIAAVTNAVAFMECVINEVLQDVTDEFDDHIGSLSRDARQRLVGYWVTGERSSILDKYDHVLKLAGLATMDPGADPAQSAAVLVALRNYFVHYRPENISTSLAPPKLASKLRGRFADNELMAGVASPWFPDHAISAGCALWAHETARAFVDHWTSLMGLANLPYQTSGKKKP